MFTLTKEQLAELRNNIVLGSLYYDDYKNHFGIDKHIVCDFFDGFIDYIYDEYGIEYCDNKFLEYDTPEYYYEYYLLF